MSKHPLERLTSAVPPSVVKTVHPWADQPIPHDARHRQIVAALVDDHPGPWPQSMPHDA